MTAHPAFGTLADLADGRSRGPATRAAAEHAAACPACSGTVAWVRDAAARMAGGAAAEPPRAALRRAFRIPMQARAAAAVEAVRTFVARLVFDSAAGAPAPAFALRGEAPRQLLFDAGPYEVEIARAGDAVRGSVLPRDEQAGGAPASGTAALYRGRRRTAEGPLDARGRFTLAGIPAGSYELRIEIEGARVLVPGLDF